MLFSDNPEFLSKTMNAFLDLETEHHRILSGEVSIKDVARDIQYLSQGFSLNGSGGTGVENYACSNTEVLTDALAMSSSNSLEDILYKIKAWMVMAPADSMEADQATCDELLAHSIMKDVMALATQLQIDIAQNSDKQSTH